MSRRRSNASPAKLFGTAAALVEKSPDQLLFNWNHWAVESLPFLRRFWIAR